MGIGIEGRTARAPGTLPHLRADVFRVSGLRVLRFRVLFFLLSLFRLADPESGFLLGVKGQLFVACDYK